MIPKFAVVGHPNKGKSTIVSALAMDDSVAISNTPGTTTKAKEYSLKVDGKTIYTLIDTPGFQRPRLILEYLEKKKNVPANKRFEILKEFIKEFENDKRFADDIELLRPIANGAGIIYVVDASKPYSLEFELDMRILSYASNPSMAILNFIDKQKDYSNEWKEVLNHYFKLVKRFNPMRSDINEYINLLEAIGHLNESWQPNIKEAIEAFKKLYNQRVKKSADEISNLVFKILEYKKKIAIKDDSKEVREKLEREFIEDIKNFEKKFFKNIKNIWDHNRINVDSKEFNFNNIELFSKESEEYFGLSKKEIITYSSLLGAAIGGGVDAALLGHTIFLGAVVGGVIGSIGGYMSLEKLSEIKVLGMELGKKYLEIGPIKNINFAFIVLNRALIFTKAIATLSYAKRDDLLINESKEILDSSLKRLFFKLHKKIIDQKDNKELKEQYSKEVEKILKRIIISP